MNRYLFAACGIAPALLLGCAAPPPIDDLPDRIAVVTALSDPIVFHDEAADDDAPALPAGTLSATDAVRFALHTDAALQAAFARVRGALADAEQTRLLPNPVLAVAVRLPEGGGKSVVEAGLSADLLALLSRPRQISAADARLRAACADVLTRALDVVAETRTQYFTVQALDARQAVFADQDELLSRLDEIAQARARAGEAARLDVLTAQAERAAVALDNARISTDRRAARLTLARMIGRPSFAADWPLEAWTAPPPSLTDEHAAIAGALRRRPEIVAQTWTLSALGDEAGLARFALFDGLETGIDTERDGNWSVGPAVATRVPVFDWGQAKAGKAKAAFIEARHDLTRIRRQIIEDVRQSTAALDSAATTLTLASEKLIPLQAARRDRAKAAYEGGFSDVTAVWLAERELLDSRATLLELQRDTSIAAARLERALGGATAAPVAQTETQRSLP